jgi:alpha-maltose-1-phosphate synthase
VRVQSNSSPPIVLAAGGTWHAPHLARQLWRTGLLRYVVTSTPPGRFGARATLPREALAWNPLPELIGPRPTRLLRKKSGLPRARYRHAQSFDHILRFVLWRNPPDLLIVFATFGLKTIRAMTRAGRISVLERGSCHAAERFRVLKDERERLGLPPINADDRMLTRELLEYQAADYIMVPSLSARRSFIERAVPGEKVLQCAYGVDSSFFRPPSSQRRRRRLLTVGNLGVEKGTPALLEAYRLLDDRSLELRLVGTVDAYCTTLLNRLNSRLPVTVCGRLAAHDLAAEYADAALFVLASIQEGQSMAVLEAMSSALPVIISDRAGYEGIMTHGREGYLVPSGDPWALANAIQAALDDPPTLHEMGRAGRLLAEQYSWDRYGNDLAEQYGRLLQGVR